MNTSLLQQKNSNSAVFPPPLAKGLPILGNAIDLAGDRTTFLRNKYLELGPVFRVRTPKKEIVVLAGPEANLFFSKEGTKYLASGKAYQELNTEFGASRSIHSMDGPDHTKLRNLLKSGYSLAVLEQNLEQAIAVVRQEVATWSTTKPQPVFYLMQRIIIEQLGLLLANYSTRDYLHDQIAFTRTLVATKVFKQIPGFVTSLPAYRRAKARVLELGRKVIANHTQQPKSERNSDLIDDLLQLFKDEPQLLPTQEDRLFAALAPFLAGMDTAASVAAFLFYPLLKHPEILKQATDEAKELFANGIPTPDSLRNLDVLYRMTLETLRMYPTIPAISRTVTTAFNFAGFHIEAGQKALIATTLSHHLPEFFPNPFEFDIERYSKPREEHRKAGVFAPFGLGPHMCLSMNLGQVLVMLNVATILQSVRLEMVPANYQLRIDPIPLPSPNSKFRIRVLERLGNS